MINLSGRKNRERANIVDTIQKDPRKKDRPTIGFLTEHSLSEYQSRMMIGVFEAAEKHDVNVIRFAARYLHNISNYEINKFYELINLLDLDGMLFLGWMPGIGRESIPEFKKRFEIPLMSLGSYYDDISNVFMDGGIYMGFVVFEPGPMDERIYANIY